MERKTKYKFLAFFMGIMLMLAIFSSNVLAADNDCTDIKVKGVLDYTKSQEVLKLVNANRKENGLSPLKMDTELLGVAMQRAAEIGIYFDHTRPNGTSCFSLSNKMHGENIAAGSATATGVMEQWMNSEGHKQNILTSDYQSIGIGCFRNGDIYYWVQCFSMNEADTVSTKTGTTNVEKVVPLLNTKATVYAYTVKNASNANYMKVTETGYMMYGILNAGWNRVYSPGVASDYIFSSSNTKVMTIDNQGKFKAVGEGTARVTVSLKADTTKSFTEEITVKRDNINTDYLYIYDLASAYQYKGSAVKPKPTVYYTMSQKLVEGKDYKLTYSNNNQIGTATVTINGIGKYKGKVSKSFKVVLAKTQGLVASSQSALTITTKWNKVSGATGYEVYMATSKNGTYKKVATITKNTTTTYKKTKLAAGKTYYFKVRAYKTANGTKKYGSYSAILTTTTKTKTPTISKVIAGSKKATVKWNKVSGASGYEIYMATSKSGKYSKVGTTTKNSATSYTKTKLVKGKTYYFKVRTYRTVAGKKVYSSYSAVKFIRVK